jgi:hypothetical protein
MPALKVETVTTTVVAINEQNNAHRKHTDFHQESIYDPIKFPLHIRSFIIPLPTKHKYRQILT